MKHIENLNLSDHGYTIVENMFSSDEIASFEYIKKDYEYPYQDQVSKGAEIVFDFHKITTFAEKLTGKNYNIFMQKVNFKPAFIGSHEIYHQDYFYRNDLNISSSKFLQVFVALSDLDYAPLNIFQGSHKLGLVEHVMCLERTGNAKYRIPNHLLAKIKDNFIPIYLKKGSALFFDYQLIHGSSSNASPIDQPRAIIQLCTEKLPNIYHGTDRRDFEKNILEKMINEKL